MFKKKCANHDSQSVIFMCAATIPAKSSFAIITTDRDYFHHLPFHQQSNVKGHKALNFNSTLSQNSKPKFPNINQKWNASPYMCRTRRGNLKYKKEGKRNYKRFAC
jgi:hypothetical protein